VETGKELTNLAKNSETSLYHLAPHTSIAGQFSANPFLNSSNPRSDAWRSGLEQVEARLMRFRASGD
jgi:hypothetical protein